MKTKLIKVGIIAVVFTGMALNADAVESEVKQSIKANGQIVYHSTQKKVDSFSDMFGEGEFYGRLRNNNFYYNYDHTSDSKSTHFISGVGASMVYKSAVFNGFDFNVGLYGSQAFFDESQIDDISHVKSGKDVISRFNYVNTGSKSIVVIGQANLNYKISKTNFTLGRQFVETFYTKSNDTKMIPNTFDGLVLSTKDIADTNLKFAYLDKQKLRDHVDSHSVLMMGDANSSSSINAKWNENDDSAMHKGLTYTALKAAGKPTDAPLIVFDVKNRSVKNLKADFSSYYVPELLSQVMGELNYKIDFGGFSLSPGVRYLQQFDNGAGGVGGASIYETGLSGYKDANSLDAQMIAARLVAKIQTYKINLGYTNILDKADLVTPWRGFPTAGYTRSMGMYNWRANTKSYRIELVKGANSSGIYKSPFIQTSILYIDGDKTKEETDSMYYYFGLIQNIPSVPELQYRLRLGYRDYTASFSNVSNYLDSRFEVNYLF